MGCRSCSLLLLGHSVRQILEEGRVQHVLKASYKGCRHAAFLRRLEVTKSPSRFHLLSFLRECKYLRYQRRRAALNQRPIEFTFALNY